MVLKERFASELGSHDDVLHEATILQSVSHPNIIRCFGSFFRKETRTVYIILEYAEAGDLYGVICQRKRKGRPFAESEIWG